MGKEERSKKGEERRCKVILEKQDVKKLRSITLSRSASRIISSR